MRKSRLALALCAIAAVSVVSAARAERPCNTPRVSIQAYCDHFWPGAEDKSSHQRCIEKSVNAFGSKAMLCIDYAPEYWKPKK